MKKFLSVLLLLTLLLSLSVSVFARYEVCPECGGRLKVETREEPTGRRVLCSVMEPEDQIYHNEYKVLERLICRSCAYVESWVLIGYTVDCPH